MSFAITLPYVADAEIYFRALGALPWAIWFDSGGRDRYDILLAEPYATLVTCGTQTTVLDEQGTWTSQESPFALLRGMLGERVSAPDGVPFCGGAAGFWGYDLARQWMPLAASTKRGPALPDMAVGLYDWALILDHHEHSAKLVSVLRRAGTAQRLAEIAQRLRHRMPEIPLPFRVSGTIQSNFSYAAYGAAFARIQHYLAAGDCYQVNLAQRFAVTAAGEGWTAYRELRRRSPAPFAAYLRLPQLEILSVSPERFLRLRAGWVETRPIKGTRPRAADEVRDAAWRAELREHPKDRAENLMIVDLLRNDLGKCCLPGSVAVPHLFEVESHANVHHLVSTVTGRLASGQDALSLLQACFPGGSITGAPKQRAMQIIAELEPDPRGIYCGAIGYIGHDGNMDSSIAIRTLVYTGGVMYAWAGGGIVADSDCATEYRETWHKASAMLSMLAHFGGVLPRPDIPL